MAGRNIGLALALLAAAGAAGCGHEARPYDVERLERKCGIVVGRELTRDELVCLAEVAGLQFGKKCPLDITDGTFGDPPAPVWFVRESCGEIGLVVTRLGAVVGVEVGDAVAPEPSPGDAP